MFASALGVCVAAVLFFFFSMFMFMLIALSMDSTPAYQPKPDTVYKIVLKGKLNDVVEENPLTGLFGETEKPLALKDLLHSIRQAKKNKNIRGIYLIADNLSAGTASLEAVRRALADFKESDKFVVAYADNYTQGGYYLCSVADEIYLNPQGILGIQGLASQTVFYTGLLEKLGIRMEIFKVGTYKGAVEPFMLEKLSEANRRQIESYLESIWKTITGGIAESRGISVETVNRFANEGLQFADPQKAVEMGFIDELKYRSDVENQIKLMAGQSGKLLKTAGYDKVSRLADREGSKKNRIAVLYAEGEIIEQAPSPSPFESEKAITSKIAQQLIDLKNDDRVKAVVFRVNSPGGSAFVSEQIWKQVVDLKSVKPVVVSMGDVAASGGYYISCGASRIVAEPATLTGSIGIFGMFPNLTGLFEKTDLHTDVVKTNTYADLGDLSRPMTDSERAIIQAYVERGYRTFLARCAEGRDKTIEEIDSVGQGRVWTGEQALAIGLVDKLGGIEDAVETAAELAGLTNYSVTTANEPKDLFSRILENKLSEVRWNLVKSFLGEDFETYRTIRHIRDTQGIQARLPFDLKPL